MNKEETDALFELLVTKCYSAISNNKRIINNALNAANAVDTRAVNLSLYTNKFEVNVIRSKSNKLTVTFNYIFNDDEDWEMVDSLLSHTNAIEPIDRVVIAYFNGTSSFDATYVDSVGLELKFKEQKRLTYGYEVDRNNYHFNKLLKLIRSVLKVNVDEDFKINHSVHMTKTVTTQIQFYIK